MTEQQFSNRQSYADMAEIVQIARQPHRLEACGYVAVRNDARKDDLWIIHDKRQVIYAKAERHCEIASPPLASWLADR